MAGSTPWCTLTRLMQLAANHSGLPQKASQRASVCEPGDVPASKLQGTTAGAGLSLT